MTRRQEELDIMTLTLIGLAVALIIGILTVLVASHEPDIDRDTIEWKEEL